jgi:hypothetical protein
MYTPVIALDGLMLAIAVGLGWRRFVKNHVWDVGNKMDVLKSHPG